jgi:hypothetical protein
MSTAGSSKTIWVGVGVDECDVVVFLDVTHGIPDHVHHRVDLRNGGARVDAVHQNGADDVAPYEGIQILKAGVTRQFVHLNQGRHRYGERRSTALWAQQPECPWLVVHAAASWSSLRMLNNWREHWQSK